MKHKLTAPANPARLKFSFRIALRYLFSKKTHNAINVITGISSAGVALGTIALVVVLSVFNGFESLFGSLFSTFDPDVKITLAEGKVFSTDSINIDSIRNHPSVAVLTEVVEENALLKYKDKQMPALIKGVSDEFRTMTQIDSIIRDGSFVLFDGAFEHAVPGVGVASMLGLGANFIDPLFIFAPKRTSRINLLRPDQSFNQSATFVSGVFSVQQAEYDDQMVLVSLDLARELFEYDSSQVTSLELKLKPGVVVKKAQQDLRQMLGDSFMVLNRYEQQESYFRIMRIEKWITYLILSFILLIASFNIIGSLSMLIIDKKADIITLRNLGADQKLIKQIFLLEGWMISIVGATIGIVLGSALSLIQEKMGIVKLGTGFIVDKYPAVTQFSDVIIVFITVLVLGFFTAWYPAKYIKIKNNQTL